MCVCVSVSDTAYVRIFVTDVNDNAPAFAQPLYEVSVEEDKEVGFILITVTANDEDEGESFWDDDDDGDDDGTPPSPPLLLSGALECDARVGLPLAPLPLPPPPLQKATEGIKTK